MNRPIQWLAETPLSVKALNYVMRLLDNLEVVRVGASMPFVRRSGTDGETYFDCIVYETHCVVRAWGGDKFYRGLQINDNGLRKLMNHIPPWVVTPTPSEPGYGNIDWRGPGQTVLSWRGPPSRYWNGNAFAKAVGVDIATPMVGLVFGEPVMYGLTPIYYPTESIVTKVNEDSTYEFESFLTPEIFKNGTVITLKPSLTTSFNRVHGAAISGAKMVIVAVGGDDFEHVLFATSSGANQRGWSQLLRVYEEYAGFGNPDDYIREYTPWFFNESGTRAVATRQISVDGTVEVHKMYLDVDFDTETYILTDAGICAEQTNSDVGEGSGIFLGDPPYAYYYGSYTRTTSYSYYAEVFDFVGDLEKSLRVDHLQTSITVESHNQFDFAASTGTVIASNRAFSTETTISFSGVVGATFAGTSSRSYSDEIVGLGHHIYSDVETGTLVDDVTLSFADLRMGLVAYRTRAGTFSYSIVIDSPAAAPDTITVDYTSVSDYNYYLLGHYEYLVAGTPSSYVAVLTQEEYGSPEYDGPVLDVISLWTEMPVDINTSETTPYVVKASCLLAGQASFTAKDGAVAISALKNPDFMLPDDFAEAPVFYTFLTGDTFGLYTSIPCNPICAA